MRPAPTHAVHRGTARVSTASALLLLATGCMHAETRPAWDAAEREPSWHVLYGAGGVQRGALRGPECRLGTDGQQVCGHHCRTGRDGRVACAATAEGTCEVRPDGRAVCTDPALP